MLVARATLQSVLVRGYTLIRALALRTLRSLAVLLLAVLCSAMLVRFAPGSNVDERELVGGLSNESVQRIREERATRHDLYTFFSQYVGDIVAGRTLNSELYGESIAPVLRERLETTAQTVSKGLLIGWCAALLLAIILSVNASTFAVAVAGLGTAILLSVPSAVFAVLCLLAQLPPYLAIAATVFPRVFPVAEEQFRASMTAPHVIFARAKGLSGARLLLAHVIPGTIPPLLALGGVSVILAIGISIPVEALVDSPGVGQLAWKAALGRDLPVLVTITLVITTLTIVLNWCIDLILLATRLRSL